MTLPDEARCRIITPALALTPSAANALTIALSKLFAQFIREGRCSQVALESQCAGCAFVIAWAPDVALSGCSHDKINAVLSAHETNGQSLLNPPPISIEVGERFQTMTRSELRQRIAAGEVTPTTRIIDSGCTQLGQWRTRGVITLGEHALAEILWPLAE